MAKVLTYSTKATIAVAFFKRPYNDIDIYVEDMSCHNVYLRILTSILPANINLASVTQVGNREKVIELCKLQQNDGRKKLFIIDGDFDHFTGASLPRIQHLYRLKAYCMENLLLNENAVLDVSLDFDPNNKGHDVKKNIGYIKWMKDTVRLLMPLFISYATVHSLAPSITTVGFSVWKLCENAANDRHTLSKTKVASRIASIEKECSSVVGSTVFKERKKEIKARVSNSALPHDRLISGKDYLLPLLKNHLKHAVGVKVPENSLKSLLARSFDATIEPSFAKALLSLVS